MLYSTLKIRVLLITLLFCLATIGQVQAKQLTILYTGDTHAALYPCDCPLAPNGGIARRASAIRHIRDGTPNVLLLDSGGACAGGMYDEHTGGIALDKARTRLYLKAMQQMGYAALALGDDELGFGLDFLQSINTSSTMKILSANAFDSASAKLIAAPYIMKHIDDTQIALIGLTPAGVPLEMEIREPLASLRQTLMQIKEKHKPDLLIVLSHLGEEKSRELLHEFPEVNILINGHSKNSLEMSEQIGSSLLLQFSFQGRKLGRLDIELDENNNVVDYKPQYINMSAEIADDVNMSALLEEFKPVAQLARVAIDFYVMYGCPYCREAEGVMQQVVAELGDKLDLALYFVPHGEEFDAREVTETKVNLLILNIPQINSGTISSAAIKKFPGCPGKTVPLNPA